MPNISFPNMFDISSGKVNTVSGETSHIQAFKSALLTNLGELLGDPSFGSDLKSGMFDLKIPATQYLLKKAIANTAEKFVPQLVVQDAKINLNNDNTTNIPITINYYTIDTGETNFIELVVLPDGSLTTR